MALIPIDAEVQDSTIPNSRRRCFVWGQIVIVFLFLELTLWAPTREIRNVWAVIAAITIFVLVLIDRPSLEHLGLRLPRTSGASLVLGSSCAAAVVLVIMVRWMGGQIPANQTWPNLQSVSGYVIWALLQEFILQSFFFNRCEELHGSSAAVWMASTLFAAAHLPSPILTTATLAGALFFCELYRRYRSVYFLGIIHATMGLAVAVVTPDSLLHHMRVGIGYLRY